MKKKSVHAELYELRQAAIKLWQHRPAPVDKEDARRWEALRLALALPAEPKGGAAAAGGH